MTVLSLPQLAAEQFRRRQTKARAVVASRQMSTAQAEAHLRPWLAIACTLGADLPELVGPFESREGNRWLAADDVCPRKVWAPLLAAARDNAMDRLHLDESEEAIGNAAALLRIALALAYDPNGHHVPCYRADLRQARAAAQTRELAA